MRDLSSDELKLIIALVGFGGVILGYVVRAVGFVIQRQWTKAGRQEQATYLATMTNIAGALRTHGMSIEEVRQVEALMTNAAISSSPSALAVVAAAQGEPSDPDAFASSPAMKARAGAAYQVVNAQLEQALTDLKLLGDDEEARCVDQLNVAWKAYRTELENKALRQYEGGTHAPLAMVLAGVAETERRMKEVRQEVAELLGSHPSGDGAQEAGK